MVKQIPKGFKGSRKSVHKLSIIYGLILVNLSERKRDKSDKAPRPVLDSLHLGSCQTGVSLRVCVFLSLCVCLTCIKYSFL